MSWRDAAACRTTDPDLFFNEELEAEAKAICRDCPVKNDCLAMVIEAEKGTKNCDLAGVFGDTTPKERVQLRREARKLRNRVKPVIG